ncbi:MAG: hypothetical protein AAGF94_17665 [Pseudomonadota bacterium]
MRFILRVVTCVLVLACVAQAAVASPRANAVLDALRISDLLHIMEVESIQSAQDLDDSMLGGTGGTSWRQIVARINDPVRIEREIRKVFSDEMPAELATSAEAFLGSTQGQRIVELELSAREALLDPAIDQMNRAALRDMRDSELARFDKITEFVEINNLVDANVVGAMTGNLAFLRGLRGGGFPAYADVSDAEIAAEVWAREPELRVDTEEWVYGFLTLAYRPLSDDDLEALIAFSDTDAGRALNRALFYSFDKVFTKTSRALGEALAFQLSGEEI